MVNRRRAQSISGVTSRPKRVPADDPQPGPGVIPEPILFDSEEAQFVRTGIGHKQNVMKISQ